MIAYMAWGFAKTHWRSLSIAFALLALFAWHKIEVRSAYKEGRAAILAEQAAEAKRRDDNAKAADDDSRKCAADPSCRLRDDGWRRD